MASTEELSENKYKIYVDVGTEDEPRKRRTKTVTVTSQRDLKNKILDFEIQCKKEAEDSEKNLENITFSKFKDRWWDVHIIQNTATSTQNSYFYYVPMLIEFFGKMKLRKIKRLHIDEFFIHEKKLGRKSLTTKMAMLKSLFGKAIEWEIIDRNPMHRYYLKGKTVPEEREIFETDELELFYKLLEHESERNRLMLLAASLGALRRGEVLGVGNDVIDFETNSVNITRSLNWDRNKKCKYLGPTKGRRDRSVIYPNSFMKELQIYSSNQNELRQQFGDKWELVDGVDLLFRTSYGAIMHPQSFTNLWKKICTKMGIKEIDLHDLRHSAASYLIRTGEEMKVVQEFLGHKKIETLMNNYVHTTPDDKSKPAKAFEKLL